MFSFTAILALVAVVTASPVVNIVDPDIATTVSICTGSFPNGGCSTLVVSGTCVNFSGAKSFFNKALTGINNPTLGVDCQLFVNFNCDDGGSPLGSVNINGGGPAIDLGVTRVPNELGNLVNFNDQTSSIFCSIG